MRARSRSVQMGNRAGSWAQLTAKTPAELKTQAIAALRSVALLVDSKAGTDSQAFKM